MNPTFTFDAELYLWKDEWSWVFLAVPVDVGDAVAVRLTIRID